VGRQHVGSAGRQNVVLPRAAKCLDRACLLLAAITSYKVLKCAPEVWFEDVIYDGVEHGATVGEPFEGQD